MKNELIEIIDEKKEKEFPLVAKSKATGLIVIFTTENTGIAINTTQTSGKTEALQTCSSCYDEALLEIQPKGTKLIIVII